MSGQEAEVEELKNGWVWVRCGGAKITISPRSHLYLAMIVHGEEEQMVACLQRAQEYIREARK